MHASSRSLFHAALTQLAQTDKPDLAAALRQILSVDATTMSVARVSYWELAPDHSKITCRVLYEHPAARFSSGGELRAVDFPGYFRALLQSKAIVADDAWTDPRTCEFADLYFRPHDIRSMLDVPVWRRGKLAGVVCHEHVGGDRAWTDDEQAFAVGIGNLVSIALEATDRKRAEEGYALVARATNDVLWDWDTQHDVIVWNEALTHVFRYEPEEVTPNLAWWLDHVHPDDRQRVEKKLSAVMASDVSGWTDQYHFIRGDGTVATVLDRGSIVRDESGRPIRMVGSMLDITSRVEMEARLALSDRMASIGTLAAGVAHEINNPLTYVLANLTLAIDEARDAEPEVILGLLREAQEGAERVRRIVRDLQTFSRPAEDDVQDIDVRTVIESTINMAWNEIRHRAQLVKDYRDLPKVRMNRARLGQVILNLLVNAAHSIKEGNVGANKITITTATSAAGEAIIEVTDTGCGIAHEIQQKIFEPFFTTKPIGIGTGLGLPICHSIVTAARGRIDVDSRVGSGTTMRVALPAVLEATRETEKTSGDQGPRRRVLLVDDEPAIRRILARILQRHDVIATDSGASALAHIRKGDQFDVILCDLLMPHMTGIELYEQLQREQSPLVSRFVFMTGGTFSASSSEFVATCARPIIDKPIDRAVLAQVFAGLA